MSCEQTQINLLNLLKASAFARKTWRLVTAQIGFDKTFVIEQFFAGSLFGDFA